MAITQVGGTEHSSKSSGGATTLSVTKPSSVASGDILIAGITCDGTVPTISGWTKFGGGTHGSASWNNALFWRLADGSEGSSFSFTVGNVGPAAAFVNAWRGVDSTTPIDGFTETEGTTSAEPNTGPTATVTALAGRMYYVRCVRDAPGDGSAVAADMTEATAGVTRRSNDGAASATGNTSYTIASFSGDTDFSGSGSQPGLAVTCSPAGEDHNYEATFAIKAQVDPATGDMAATLPKVVADLAGERTMPDGPMAVTLPKVVASFAGTAAPPSGTLDTVLSPVVAAFTGGQSHGGAALTLPSVTSQFAGAVNPAGIAALTLPSITSQFAGETQPFGEHVIRVEDERRAFRVIQDDPGLIPIFRHQVTQE